MPLLRLAGWRGARPRASRGSIGHVQAVGDAFEDVRGADCSLMPRMISLTRPCAIPVAVAMRVWLKPRVLAQQPEEGADVTPGESLGDGGRAQNSAGIAGDRTRLSA